MSKKKTPIKSEKLFIEDIYKNINSLVKVLRLPKVKKAYKEKELVSGLFGTEGRIPTAYRHGIAIPRVDILLQHKNKTKATIIEVKIYKSIHDLTVGLGQLLFYQEFLKKVTKNITKVKIVLIADKIPVSNILAQVIRKNGLGVEIVEWNGGIIKALKAIDLGSRPNIWDNPIKLQEAIDNYFKTSKKPTVSGLAYMLGMSRETFYSYEDKGKFSDIIKKARNRIESNYEEKLIYSGQPTGVIFALKNMGWRDNQNIDHTTGGEKLKVGVVSYAKAKEVKKKVKEAKVDGK